MNCYASSLNIFRAILVFSCFSLHAQVGINNTAPQQALHVSGTGTDIQQPIIRIDGLNVANNPANDASVKRVMVTANGDLVIMPTSQLKQSITTPMLPPTTISGGTNGVITSQSFTLSYPSIVHFDAKVGIGVGIIGTSSASTMTDNMARVFGVYYSFTSAPTGVVVNTPFGQETFSYTTNNGVLSNNGAYQNTIGSYYLNPTADLFLPVGTYTVTLYGFSQQTDQLIQVNSTSQPSQVVRIVMTPTSF